MVHWVSVGWLGGNSLGMGLGTGWAVHWDITTATKCVQTGWVLVWAGLAHRSYVEAQARYDDKREKREWRRRTERHEGMSRFI